MQSNLDFFSPTPALILTNSILLGRSATSLSDLVSSIEPKSEDEEDVFERVFCATQTLWRLNDDVDRADQTGMLRPLIFDVDGKDVPLVCFIV